MSCGCCNVGGRVSCGVVMSVGVSCGGCDVGGRMSCGSCDVGRRMSVCVVM